MPTFLADILDLSYAMSTVYSLFEFCLFPSLVRMKPLIYALNENKNMKLIADKF